MTIIDRKVVDDVGGRVVIDEHHLVFLPPFATGTSSFSQAKVNYIILIIILLMSNDTIYCDVTFVKRWLENQR
jgi:hypothetical protein